MRSLLFIAAAALATAMPAAAAVEKKITQVGMGCTDRDVHSQLTKIAVSGDKEAFAKLASAGVATGICRLFSLGDDVYVEDVATFSGVACVRPKGETSCFWLAIESIRD